jgi:hypothetical protein
MVIILAKLGSNINYEQGRGTVLTFSVAATHEKWEGDAILDKAQLYKLNLHTLSNITKAQRALTEGIHTLCITSMQDTGFKFQPLHTATHCIRRWLGPRITSDMVVNSSVLYQEGS